MKSKVLVCLMAIVFLAGCGAGTALAEQEVVNADVGVGDKYYLLNGWITDFNEGVYPYSEEDSDYRTKNPLYGYKNLAEEVIIPPWYSVANAFSEGLAFVVSDGMPWGGYIDITGKYIIPPVFDNGWEFVDGRAIVNVDGAAAIINKKGEFLLTHDYYYGIEFSTAISKYICKNEEYVDLLSNDLILEKTLPYQQCETLTIGNKNYIRYANSDGKNGVLEYPSEKVVVPPETGGAYYENGVFVVYDYEENVVKIYDLNGSFKVSFEADSLETFHIVIITEDKYYIFDRKNNERYFYENGVKTNTEYYLTGGQLTDSLFVVTNKDYSDGSAVLHGVIDQNGELVIPVEYDSFVMKSYSGRGNAMPPWSEAGFQGFITTKGGQIFALKQDGTIINQFPGVPIGLYYSDTVAFAYHDDKNTCYVLDKDLEEYFKIKCREANVYVGYNSSVNIVSADGAEYAIIDKNSDIIVMPQYVSMEPVRINFRDTHTHDNKLYIREGFNKKHVNGKMEIIHSESYTTAPIIQSNRMMVPVVLLPYSFASMHISTWDRYNEGTTIQFFGKSLTFYTDSDKAELRFFDYDLNDYRAEELVLDVPANSQNGALFVPLRTIADAFELDVFWDNETGLTGVGTVSVALVPWQIADIAGSFEKGIATVEELRRMDASLATQPYLDFISARLLGVEQGNVDAIADYTNTIPAYEALIAGKKDLILVTEPSPSIVNQATAKGVELEIVPFAKEGFVFLVNAANPVKDLTQEQLRDIYQGKITNWQQVGGPELPIVAYQRNQDSGSQTIMENVFMKDLKLTNPITTRVYSMAGLIEVVAEFSEKENGGIGYSVYFYAREMVGNPQVDLIALDGVEPSSATIRDETYPVVVYYYAVKRKDDQSAATQKLLDFVLSGQGQTCVNESGLVSVE
ncbi:MAG: substrate-binding domain-containing protein [Peptococcaceae bacterium]|nr:substrate-binding domain-containing protein [Peptococcaceae bacterium]